MTSYISPLLPRKFPIIGTKNTKISLYNQIQIKYHKMADQYIFFNFQPISAPHQKSIIFTLTYFAYREKKEYDTQRPLSTDQKNISVVVIKLFTILNNGLQLVHKASSHSYKYTVTFINAVTPHKSRKTQKLTLLFTNFQPKITVHPWSRSQNSQNLHIFINTPLSETNNRQKKPTIERSFIAASQ